MPRVSRAEERERESVADERAGGTEERVVYSVMIEGTRENKDPATQQNALVLHLMSVAYFTL